MPREIYGNKLPEAKDSKDSDIFHNLKTGEDFVFDGGSWFKAPQTESIVPVPELEDIGKSIVVGPNHSYALVGPFGAVPSPKTQDRGKTVKVKSDANQYELVKVPDLPTPESTDSGKVVKVNSSGAYELGEAGGGSGTNVLVSYYGGMDKRKVTGLPTNFDSVSALIQYLNENPITIHDYLATVSETPPIYTSAGNLYSIAVVTNVTTLALQLQINITDIYYYDDNDTIVYYTSDDSDKIIYGLLTSGSSSSSSYYDYITGRELNYSES